MVPILARKYWFCLFDNININNDKKFSNYFLKKYDLIFLHTLVPHQPSGYDSNCKYDGFLSFNKSFMKIDKQVEIHNNERICMLKFLDTF